MQLKLDLFEESLDKYRRGKGQLKQKELQTGKPIGTFNRFDPHPTISGLFYKRSFRGNEYWVDSKENIEKSILKDIMWNRSDKALEYRKTTGTLKSRLYKKTNKGKATRRAYKAKSRAVKKEASVKLNKKEKTLIKYYYEWSTRLQNKLGIDFHVDHIVPLAKGGLHHPLNLQVVPAKWNCSKGDRHTERWLPNGM